jgi:phage N-6-adenine-methyltransferase
MTAMSEASRMTTGLFSSRSDEWATPPAVFDALNKEFSFAFDVCATRENAKCRLFYTKEVDGLKQEWKGTCFLNPPYGKTIGLWMKKALEESRAGATVVCLVHSRTDTVWWHLYAMQADEIRFVKGRLKFGDGKGSRSRRPSSSSGRNSHRM